jgi:hypothetical protein
MPQLETEVATYKRLLPELLQHEGRHAVIAGTQLLGLWDTYGDALMGGYKQRGIDRPFMVKQIFRVEIPKSFSRDFTPS